VDVRVTQDVNTMSLNIRIRVGVDTADPSREVWLRSDNGMDIVPLGAEPPLYLKLPEQVAEAIFEWWDKDRDEEVASDRHLRDAIKVRDWAMGIVERLAVPVVEAS
jgi:hypothetical protein